MIRNLAMSPLSLSSRQGQEESEVQFPSVEKSRSIALSIPHTVLESWIHLHTVWATFWVWGLLYKSSNQIQLEREFIFNILKLYTRLFCWFFFLLVISSTTKTKVSVYHSPNWSSFFVLNFLDMHLFMWVHVCLPFSPEPMPWAAFSCPSDILSQTLPLAFPYPIYTYWKIWTGAFCSYSCLLFLGWWKVWGGGNSGVWN